MKRKILMKIINISKSFYVCIHRMVQRTALIFGIVLLVSGSVQAQQTESVQRLRAALSDTTQLKPKEEELSLAMRKGMNRYLDRYARKIIRQRGEYWHRSFASDFAYRRSVAPNRERLRKITGVVDKRVPKVAMERFVRGNDHSTIIAETDRYIVQRVRWSTLNSTYGKVDGEGLLLTPKGKVRARVVALPDADQTPEQIAGLAPGVKPSSQFARRLAESGVQVVVPALINRKSTFAGSDSLINVITWKNPELVSKWTNVSNREWIYRQAYQMGRHVIGFEVEKMQAAIDWFHQQDKTAPVGVAGYGEGGLLAFYAAAMDTRIDAALVSGYFRPRDDDLWKEPLYRNVWGLLKQFGDAEMASLIAPRALIVEYSNVPKVGKPLTEDEQDTDPFVRSPNRLKTPSLAEVQHEIMRIHRFFPDTAAVQPNVQLMHGNGKQPTTGPGCPSALRALLGQLGVNKLAKTGPAPSDRRKGFNPGERQQRMVEQLTNYLQQMVQLSDRSRYSFIDGDRSSPAAWDSSMDKYRNYLWDEIFGRLPNPGLSPDPVMRKIYDKKTWTGYEVMLNVWPDVFTFGILAVPKDLKPGEKRPVVVTQHGAGSLPRYTYRPEPNGKGGSAYNSYATRLAGQGFVVFAPANPDRGRFRMLSRKGNPMKVSVFSLILAANQQVLKWLKGLDYVDADHIGFYGLSWGGRTAIRVPALLKDYALSIQSGDFNRWNLKVMTTHYRNSYMFSPGAFETYEFNLGHTFGHAEMAGLIAPRPFMVESGYRDRVAADEWVGYEFAKVRRLYDLLGISKRALLDFFDGVHEIHGKDDTGTFHFLHEYLHWPKSYKSKNL